jgi:DNA repair exonuclease SbcCD nuclease subunit
MKILATADLHITNSHSKFKCNKDGVSDLLIAQYNFISLLADELGRDEYDALVFLGDWLDKNILDPIVATYSNKMMSLLLKTGKPVIIIEGNHCISDEKNLYTIVGSMGELANYNNAYFVTSNDSVRIGDVIFHCFPYKTDYEEVESEIAAINRQLDTDLINVMLFHLPTTNAVLDNGCPSEKGVNLSRDIIDNFDVCLGGDFHRPQKLINTDNAYYVGAPFDLKFGQDGERGYKSVVLSKGTVEIEHHDNPFNYPMLTLTQDLATDVLDGDWDLSTALVRLEPPIDPDIAVAMKEQRKNFYSLSIPSYRVIPEQRAAKTLSTFSRTEDLHVIKSELETLTDDKPLIQEALNLLTVMVE